MRIPDVFTLPIPPTDHIFFARVIRLDDPPFLVKFTYDAALRITRMERGLSVLSEARAARFA